MATLGLDWDGNEIQGPPAPKPPDEKSKQNLQKLLVIGGLALFVFFALSFFIRRK